MALAILPNPAMAANAGGATGITTNDPNFQSSFQTTIYSINDDIKRQSVFELLSTNSKNCVDPKGTPIVCDWPPFPRVWYEVIDGSNFNTKIAVTAGMSVKIPGVFEARSGVEIVPYNYTYATEVSMQVITTRQMAPANSPNVSPTPAVDGDDLEQFFYLDTTTDPSRPTRYFNVTKNNPMVGFCTYRMALRSETSMGANGNVTLRYENGIFGADGSLNTSATQTGYHQEGITLQSQFFQIEGKDGHISVDQYVGIKCKQQFMPTARKFIQKAFDAIVLSNLGQWLPGTQCQPYGESDENGDMNCQTWFASQPSTTRAITVPRCVLNKDKIGRCKALMKPGKSCAMYINVHTGQVTDQPSLYGQVTTTAIDGAQCDVGTKCTTVNAPVIIPFVSLPVWPGYATCQ